MVYLAIAGLIAVAAGFAILQKSSGNKSAKQVTRLNL